MRGTIAKKPSLIKRIGQKIKETDWNVIARKAKNSVQRIREHAQNVSSAIIPIADSVAAGAGMLGLEGIAAPAAAVAAGARAFAGHKAIQDKVHFSL